MALIMAGLAAVVRGQRATAPEPAQETAEAPLGAD